MLLHLSDISSEPLHGQISRQIRAMILSGDLSEDAPLPSIRGMAREQHVSVITVQRAYDDLEREGLIHSKRGKGFFVAKISDVRKQEIAKLRLREKMEKILYNGIAEGVPTRVIEQVVQDILMSKGEKK